MKRLILFLIILIPFAFSACSKKADEAADSKVELAKAEADKAKAEADKAKAEADKAKAEADKVKAEAGKAKAEADKAMAEAIANEDEVDHVDRYTPPEDLPDLDGTLRPKGLILVMGVRPERGVKTLRTAGTEDGTYIIEEIFDNTIAFSTERRKSMGSDESIDDIIRHIVPDASNIYVENDDKMSARLTYPTHKITYQVGQNEDTRKCVDYYIQTDEFDYRFHTSIAIDQFKRNTHHLEAWFENLELRD